MSSSGVSLTLAGLRSPVDDRLLVRRFEAFGDLDEKQDGLVDRDRSAGDSIRQRLAFDQLHRQEPLAIGLLEPIERGDICVIQLREQLRLTLEPIQTFFVAGELFGKDFDGDVASEFRVTSTINLAHATCSDGLDDFVGTELGSCSKGHGDCPLVTGEA